MDDFSGKIKTKNSLIKKPYARPVNKSLFSRVSDSVKNLFTPITPHWLSKKTPTLDSGCRTSKNMEHKVDSSSTNDFFTTTQKKSVYHRDSAINMLSMSSDNNEAHVQTPCVLQNNAVNVCGYKELTNSEELLKFWSNSDSQKQQTAISSSFMLKQNSNNMVSNVSLNILNSAVTPKTKIQYGGTSAYKSRACSVPYKIPSVRKIKVKTSSKMSPSIVGISSKTGISSMSSTAKKILLTLDKISTPLHNSNYTSASKYKRSHHMVIQKEKMEDCLSTGNSNISLPPVQDSASLSPVFLHATANIPLDNRILSQGIIHHVPPNKIGNSVNKTATGQSRNDHPNTLSHNIGAGGKIKKNRRIAHYASAAVEKQYDFPLNSTPVPDVPFPISKSLPTFTFGFPGSTSTPAVPKTNNVIRSTEVVLPLSIASTTQQPTFTFALPTVRYQSANEVTNQATISDLHYIFCSPRKVGNCLQSEGNPFMGSATRYAQTPGFNEQRQNLPLKENVLNHAKSASGSVMDILGYKQPGINDKNTVRMSDILASKQVGKWECQTCLLWNESNVDQCTACKTKRVVKNTVSSVSVTSAGSKWECNLCMLINKTSDKKCIACGNPSPTNSQPKLDKWICSVCLIKNKHELGNCEACNNPKPVMKMNVLPKLDTGKKWECSSCLLRNDANKTSCVACLTQRAATTTNKPSIFIDSEDNISKKSKSFQKSENSKLTWDCNVCLLQNTLENRICVACQSPQSENTEKKTTCFAFGTSSASLLKFSQAREMSCIKQTTSKLTSASSELEDPHITTGVSKKGLSFEPCKTDNKKTFLFGVSKVDVNFDSDNAGSNTTKLNEKPAFTFGTSSKTSFSCNSLPLVETCVDNVSATETLTQESEKPGKFGTSTANPKHGTLSFGLKHAETKHESNNKVSSSCEPASNPSFTLGSLSKQQESDVKPPIASGQSSFKFGGFSKPESSAKGFTFGSQNNETNFQNESSFNFGVASASQIKSSGFNFGTRQQTQTDSSGLFHFKTSTTSSVAEASNTFVPSAVQASTNNVSMFHIGQTSSSGRSTVAMAGRQIKRATRRYKK